MQKFWMVGGDPGRAPVVRHLSLESARAEAERLARVNGGRFFVLEGVLVYERQEPPVGYEWLDAAEPAAPGESVAPSTSSEAADDDLDGLPF